MYEKTLSFLLALLICITPLTLVSCTKDPETPSDTTALSVKDTASVEDTETEYNVISADDYMDKTTAAFLSKLIAFTTDYKFVWNKNGTPRVALPDNWFGWCKGSDTPNNPYHQKIAKLLYNDETSMYDLYIADTFGIEILNLYILRDMYDTFGTITTKTITDGWVQYNVWDMGGGNRSQGAYALAKNYGYVAPFLGAAEYGNRYPWCEEPWICNNTLGLLTAGMPNEAIDISKIFGSVTGDSDNLLWVDFIAAMYSMAYFEDDIPTLIRKAAEVFPENSWQHYVVDHSFELYEKYPTNWRRAVVQAEMDVFRRCFYYHTDRSNNQQGQVDVNMAFSILSLLYGDGDYEATAKVFSLSGYDARGVIFLPILGIIGGMDVIPDEGLNMIWQNGDGEIVNLPVVDEKGWWMHHEGLPERMKLSDIMEMFRENFESILIENGGKIENGMYYIPKSEYRIYDHVLIDNADFENGTLNNFSVIGDTANAEITEYAYLGEYAAKITGSSKQSGIYTTVSGLQPGETYKMTAYVIASLNSTAHLFARATGADAYQHASVQFQPEFVKREFVFVADAETMELGILLEPQDKYGYTIVDEITVVRIAENAVSGIGEVKITSANKGANTYSGKITVQIEGNCDKQVYLKLRFANTSGQIVNAAVTVNGTSFGTVPFYKTGSAYAEGSTDCVYIPVILNNASNTVALDIGKSKLIIASAEIITITDRLIVSE